MVSVIVGWVALGFYHLCDNKKILDSGVEAKVQDVVEEKT